MSASHSAEGGQPRFPVPIRDHGTAGLPTSRDAALVERVLAGERYLFHELVGPYERSIYLVTFRILQNKQEAEDATQDTLLKALKKLHHFRGEAKFSTWLISIAVNEARVRLRRERIVRFESVDDATRVGTGNFTPLVIADNRDIPLQTLEREELHEILRLAIARLPKTYRQILLLRYVEELSTRETAAILGVRAGAVKTRLFRARTMVQHILTRHPTRSLNACSKRGKESLSALESLRCARYDGRPRTHPRSKDLEVKPEQQLSYRPAAYEQILQTPIFR